MSIDTITPRIELLQEQIMNLEQSGRFTEKEMDRQTAPLRLELACLSHYAAIHNLGEDGSKFQTTADIFLAAIKKFSSIFNTDLKPCENINVIDAEILTPNTNQA